MSQAALMVTERIAAAERLLASGRMVGDHQDYDLWSRTRSRWSIDTTDVLKRVCVEPDAASTFEWIVSMPPVLGQWCEDLPLHLERVRAGIEKLRSLAGESATGKSIPFD
jgi:hypothetical protein